MISDERKEYLEDLWNREFDNPNWWNNLPLEEVEYLDELDRKYDNSIRLICSRILELEQNRSSC